MCHHHYECCFHTCHKVFYASVVLFALVYVTTTIPAVVVVAFIIIIVVCNRSCSKRGLLKANKFINYRIKK